MNDEFLNRVQIVIAAKTVDDQVNAYKNMLLRIASDTYLQRMDAIDMWRQHKAMLDAYGRQTFLDGLIAGGVTNPAENMDDEERAYLANWIKEQKGYAESFARWVAAIEAGAPGLGDLARLNDRIDLWVEAMRALGSAAFAFARKNQMSVWHLGGTEQHCQTCAWLDGKRRRLKWFLQNGYIPRQPGSPTLECGGWRCDCYIVSTTGEWLLPV